MDFPKYSKIEKFVLEVALKGNLEPMYSRMNLVRIAPTFESWKVVPDYKDL